MGEQTYEVQSKIFQMRVSEHNIETRPWNRCIYSSEMEKATTTKVDHILLMDWFTLYFAGRSCTEEQYARTNVWKRYGTHTLLRYL